MPANFNPTLPINNGVVEWPAGPYFPSVGEALLRVDVWVMQKTTGAIQSTYGDNFPPAPMNWTTTDLVHHEGVFQRGAALGTAVAVVQKYNGPGYDYYWWSEEVTLI